MVIFSLDSSIIVELIRGEKPHFRRFLDTLRGKGDEVRVSSVVLQELAFGAFRSPRPQHHLDLLRRFISDVIVEPWTAEDALFTARVRADLEAAGGRIGAYDTLIAGQALCRGWGMITSNVREFVRVEGLHVTNWTDPAGPREARPDGDQARV